MNIRRLVLVLCIGALFAASLTALSPGANAAVPGLQRVSDDSDLIGSESVKTADVTCPAGKRVVGTGAQLIGPGGSSFDQALLEDVLMFGGNPATSVFVKASEDVTGTASSWRIRVWAICADPLPGLQLVTSSSGATSDGKTTTVSCPSGTSVLGFGGSIVISSSLPGRVSLTSLTPNLGLTGATVVANENRSGTASTWSLTAYAICANPLPGVERVETSTPSDPTSTKGATAGCLGGRSVIATGAAVVSGPTPRGNVFLNAMIPTASTPPTAVAFATEDQVGTGAPWLLASYAVCAPA